MQYKPLDKQRGYMLGINLSIVAQRRVATVAVSPGFFLLADGSSKFLLANAVDRFLTSGG